MNIRDYTGQPLTFDQLSQDARPRAIASVIADEKAYQAQKRAEKIAGYKKMSLDTRINTGTIRSLIKFDAHCRATLEKLKDAHYAELVILDNLCMFTAEGIYLIYRISTE